jgi:phosphonoacetate hydrolase
LGKDLNVKEGSIIFSSEKADRCTLAQNGVENVLDVVDLSLPNMYSANLSLFVLHAGLKLFETRRPELMYLSLSDYVQHKYEPDAPEAIQFYSAIDEAFGRLDGLGAILAVTADHGMRGKSNPDGSPRVIWLQDFLDHEFGRGCTKVVCPITDYFVAHHGSLGSFVRIHCLPDLDKARVISAVDKLAGIDMVCDRMTAVSRFELPVDREADIVVISDADTCVGTTPSAHDLSALGDWPLRTHGGLAESVVPFILNRPIRKDYMERTVRDGLRNFHIFDFAINGVTH